MIGTKQLLALAFLIITFSANQSNAQLIATNCVDASGRQVGMRDNPGQQNFYARLERGYPVIIWDSQFASRLQPETQTFFYFHECAHHVLGHSYFNIPTTREKQADCWAIQQLTSRGILSRQQLRVAQREIARFPGDWWVYLPGPQRAISWEACTDYPDPVEPVCEIVDVPETYTVLEVRNAPVRGPCQHSQCGPMGCFPVHAFDWYDNFVEVPVTRQRMRQERVCY